MSIVNASAAELADRAALEATRAGLELRQGASGPRLCLMGGPCVVPDGHLLANPRRGRDPLWRAVLGGSDGVIDATAGLGADAFHLAAKGARVIALERSAALAFLLSTTLARAAAGEFGAAALEAAARVTLVQGDAVGLMAGLPPSGVVYLDPMFPTAEHGSAAPPKGMAVLRRLFAAAQEELSAEDELALLGAARSVARRRVAVKRPLRAPPLGGVQPSGAIEGRTVRYDLYAPL